MEDINDNFDIPEGWPETVIFKGKRRKVSFNNIPAVRHPVSPYGPSNDYKGTCPHCGSWMQTDDR